MIILGQIGLNYGLNVHIPSFLSDERFKLIGVCSRNSLKADSVRDQLGLQFSTTNPEELIAKVDAVSIAVPPKEQAIILPKAIDKGLHVFFEKPLGYLPEVEYELKGSQSLMPDFEFLEVDVWKKLIEVVHAKKIGEILHAEIIWNVETFAVSNNLESWKTNPEETGGVLNNFSPHCFNYLEKIMGKIKSLQVKTSGHITRPEDSVYILLDFHSGASGMIALSTNTYKGLGHLLEITGTEGTATIKNFSSGTLANFELEVNSKSGESLQQLSNLKSIDSLDDRVIAVSSLVKRFGDWIQKGEIQTPNMIDSIRVEILLEACRKSLTKGQEVFLK